MTNFADCGIEDFKLFKTILETITNHNVMLKKQFYEAPESELLLVKFEGNIMSPIYASPGKAGEDAEYNSYDEDF